MNPIPRFARRAFAEASSSWSCLFCQRGGSQWQQIAANAARATPKSSPFAGSKRFFSGSFPKRQQPNGRTGGGAAPGMDRINEAYKRRNRSTAVVLKLVEPHRYYTISIVLGTVALSYGSVPMYKMICQTTGYGGQPVRAHGLSPTDTPEDLAARLEPVTSARRLRVTFSASVSDVLPWKFTPQQREVRVLPGETALAFYTATNNSDKDIIGVATYSVTPAQTAPYFSKIQCFCFEEQRLAAGETVDMPVFFYLDPDLLKDVNMRNVETVTLNYTFFKARYDDNGRFKGAPTAGG